MSLVVRRASSLPDIVAPAHRVLLLSRQLLQGVGMFRPDGRGPDPAGARTGGSGIRREVERKFGRAPRASLPDIVAPAHRVFLLSWQLSKGVGMEFSYDGRGGIRRDLRREFLSCSRRCRPFSFFISFFIYLFKLTVISLIPPCSSSLGS